jgi:phage FluMu protein Com
MKPDLGHKVAAEGELRCECGHLLAKLTTEGIEMKCRKCKHVHVLKMSPAALTGVSPPVKKTRRKGGLKQQEGGRP